MSTYLVLPANASHDIFPDNKNHNYKIHLPERLRLEGGQWEIALRSITFNNNWYNVKNGYIDVRVEGYVDKRVVIKDGRYESVKQLWEDAHAAFESMFVEKIVQLFYDEDRNIMHLMFFRDGVKVRFSPDLAQIFGFDASVEYDRPSELHNYIEGNSIPDIEAGYETLYVYCSLCANRFVGDSLVPCLYNVPVSPHSTKSTVVHQTILPPMYVPAVNTDTDEIEIDIRRGDGQPVLFRGGCVIVTVHLRKKKTKDL